jgi:hypothetical protein
MKMKSPILHFLSAILVLGFLAGCEKVSVAAQNDNKTTIPAAPASTAPVPSVSTLADGDKNGETKKGKIMNTFDSEYFFILASEDDRVPFLGPDKDTQRKGYQRTVQPTGAKPFIFHNSSYEEGDKILPIDPPPEILFSGSDLLVNDRIAEKLRDLDIPNLAIQAAIFIDHKDVWHENYWFLTFPKRFDCWDRGNSTYDPDPVRDETPKYEIYTYSLNEKLLRETPLKERLLFEMGGTTDGFVVVHKSIVDLFRVKWVDIVPITDYGVNYP